MNDPSAVASTVAGVLRVWETATEATVDAITRFVADRSILVVLDNCEHVIDAAADLADRLLATCPRLTILATSREPLGVPGRDRLAGAVPLVPGAGDQVGVVELSMFDAVRLFADRARRARPGFALTEVNAGAVGEICSRLDGIPLALELAAARCRAMAPHKIAEELDRRFLLLTGGARTVLARQQTLLASMEWSQELLAPDERAVFRRLGAFSGPFPLDAAEAVCGDASDAGWAVFDVLSRLVDKSLVVHDPDTDWYRLLETIRLYAVDRLREAGELEATRDRHAAWWYVWLGTHHPDGPSDSDLDAIDRAYPNLRVALQWAATTEPELALELAGGLSIYWYLRGVFGHAIALGDLALAQRRARTGLGPRRRAHGHASLLRQRREVPDDRRRRSVRHRRDVRRSAHPAALPGDGRDDPRGQRRVPTTWPERPNPAVTCGSPGACTPASPSGASSLASPIHPSLSSARPRSPSSSTPAPCASSRSTSLPRSSPPNSRFGRRSLGWSRPWASPTGPRPRCSWRSATSPATARSVGSRRRSSG